MEEIRGTVATAISFAKLMEDGAREQIQRMCSYACTEGSRIRIMPDVHAGKGCTIGTTMTITDRAVPNIVGVDIGCGMYTVSLGKAEPSLRNLDEGAHHIPSGMDVWNKKKADFDLSQLCCYSKLKDTDRIERSIGTLGGGNHFIEVDKASDGTYYLVIHSGSRNLGKQVAEIYQKMAVEQNGRKRILMEKQKELIHFYRATGRQKEIQQAIAGLRESLEKDMIPDDLCFVTGKDFQDYLHDIALCQEFARLNREMIARELLKFTGITSAGESFHTIHNYIDTEEMILRKGAIAAHKGERVLIPINMRDGSVLAVGKGNPDWNYSAPHGAGRIMSRAQAKHDLSLEEYKKEMQGIYSTSISKGTLDESPMAYKSLHDILDVIGDTVDVLDILKPVYNFKAETIPFSKLRKEE